jgi:hypothetical protein
MPDITGTSRGDNIIETVSASTIRALRGDDMVVVTGDDNRLDGAAADDELTVIGDRNLLLGGDDNDTLSAAGDDNTLRGGRDDDSLQASGNRTSIPLQAPSIRGREGRPEARVRRPATSSRAAPGTMFCSQRSARASCSAARARINSRSAMVACSTAARAVTSCGAEETTTP